MHANCKGGQHFIGLPKELQQLAASQMSATLTKFLINLTIYFWAVSSGPCSSKLQVSFVGEPGLDMGGLTKEWFQLLIKQIFDADYGMFVYHAHSRYPKIWRLHFFPLYFLGSIQALTLGKKLSIMRSQNWTWIYPCAHFFTGYNLISNERPTNCR